MSSEVQQLELERLRNQQAEARMHEVFGGLTTDEQAAYDQRQGRIRELESDSSRNR